MKIFNISVFKKKSKDAMIFSWFLAISWMVLIFIASSMSSVPGGTTLSESNYSLISSIVHVILYAVLCGLLINAFIVSGVNTGKALLYGFLIAILYGITDEFHQMFVPNREAHLSDWLLDIVGALIVFYFCRFKYKK